MSRLIAFLCLLMVCLAGRASAEQQEVRFIVLSDTQFANPHVFERMAYEIELLRPQFVIQVGDLIQGYTHDHETLRAEWRRFRAQLGPLSALFYPVPGNHDVTTPEAVEVYAEVWGEDRFHYTFDKGNVHVIVLNAWHQGEDDRIAPWQQEWLRAHLDGLREKHGDQLDSISIFVFLHSPLWRYAEDHTGRQDWDVVAAMLREFPVRLVAAGHTHEHVWQHDDEEGLDYLVFNSSGGMGGNHERAGHIHSFLHVSVLGDDVRFATIRAGSVFPLDTVDSTERRTVGRHLIPNTTLRVPGIEQGQPLDIGVTHTLANRLRETRRYELTWRTPFGSPMRVEPAHSWVEVAPGASVDATFRLTADAAPAADAYPALEVRATETLRTGIVSRDEEARLRRQWSERRPDDPVLELRLEEPTTFSGTVSLFVPPVARVPRVPVTSTIQIDGDLADIAWVAARPVTDFRLGDGSDPEVATEVRLLYDDEYLYVGARLEEPAPEGLSATAEGAIPFTWNDDDLELFFMPPGKGYSRLFQNVAGTRFNSYPRDIPEDIRYHQSQYDSAIVVGDDHWSIEMRIPWSDVWEAEPPTAGTEWSFQIGRHRPQGSVRQMQWSGAGLYDPSRWGVLRFE